MVCLRSLIMLMLSVSIKSRQGVGAGYFKTFGFLDSTMCRIWTKNADDLTCLYRALKENNELLIYGEFIHKVSYKENKIPQSREMGDLVWWAKEGSVIWPVFSKTKVKGMHGYK